ncbi:enterobactin transporter EntS [Salinactinospora qingdaonensis]|uniref:Multidrug efflux pump Tap n=1 Tax=Salinactinospora qingdaonensis TaxID=702744 RepID=A0ABP7F0N0_9ACTN
MKPASIAIDITPLQISREFRIAFTARLISLVGIGFTTTALPLQVYAMTRSSLLVATVAATAGVSMFAGTLTGGVLADRLDRRRLIIGGRLAATVAFVLLAANTVVPEHPLLALIYACAALNGFLGSFSTVALQAAAPGFVPPDRLAAAGALLAMTAKLGMAISPALAGLIIAVWGFGVNYSITAVAGMLTVAMVWRLPSLHPPARQGAQGARSLFADIAAGLSFAARDRTVGPLLLVGFLLLLFASPQVLIPAFNDRVLDGSEFTAGLLYAAPATGAAVGSLTSGWTGRVRHTGSFLLGAVAVCGGAVVGLGIAPTLVAALVALTFFGVGQIVEEILRYALLQSHTPDALRGRVNSLWTAQATAGGALGSLTLGAIVPLVGVSTAIVIGGAATVAAVTVIVVSLPGLRRAGVAPAVPGNDSGISS